VGIARQLPFFLQPTNPLNRVQALTVVLFLYGLSGGAIEPLPIALSALTLAVFLAIETLVATDPIIPLGVLRSRAVLLTCVAQLGFMSSRWTVLFYAPTFGLAVRGLSLPAAGAVLVPTNAGFAAGGILVGALHVRRPRSFWRASVAALALAAAAVLATSRASTRDAPWAGYQAALVAHGLCTGAALNYTLSHLLHRTRPADHFVAAGLLATFRGFGGSFGTAVGGGAFVRHLTAAMARGFAALDGGHGDPGPARRETIRRLAADPGLVFRGSFLTAAERGVAVAAYEGALASLYQWAALVGVVVVLVQAGTGWSDLAPTTGSVDEAEGVREPLLGRDGERAAGGGEGLA